MISGEIVVQNLCKTFRSETGQEHRVLEDLSFEIPRNELVTIIGPSGCGKTTFLNLVAGLTKPTSGRVIVGGFEVTGPSAKLGVVFQQDAVFMWRRTLENAEFGLEIRGLPKKERREIALRYLNMVGLGNFTRFYPKELSGGMKKRLQLATVWANDPEILVMDEPFGTLDYVTKTRLQAQVQRMWMEDPRTIVFVTHDIEEAIFLADRVLVFTHGGMKDDVSVEFERPRVDDLRVSLEFQEVKRRLWGYLA